MQNLIEAELSGLVTRTASTEEDLFTALLIEYSEDPFSAKKKLSKE